MDRQRFTLRYRHVACMEFSLLGQPIFILN